MRALIVLAILATAACGDNIVGNREPTVEPVELITLEDLAVTRTLTVVDFDPGDLLTAAVETEPDHGTVTIAGLSLTYGPAPDYHGSDRFELSISDGFVRVPLVVDVSVESIPDQPIGGPETFATNEDSARDVPIATLLENDTDADGDPITLSSVGTAVNGTVTIVNGTTVRFQPDANFNGGASFVYTITDGMFTTPVTVAVVVGAVNDPPVAVDDTVSTAEDTAVTISGATLRSNDSDPEGQTLTIDAVSPITGGTVALNGGNPIFTPTLNFTGNATFQYTLSDGVATDTAVVTVQVGASNDGPDAVNDSATTDEDTSVVISVLANDTDPDSTPTVESVSNEQGGTATINGDGTITFAPTLNFNGSASFQYTITDGTLDDTATVTITVDPVDDGVTAVNDLNQGTTDEKTQIQFTTLLANDINVDAPDDTLSIISVGNANNGTVSRVGNTVTFTPTSNAIGDVTGSFDYEVSDGVSSTDIGSVTFTITAVNDPPVAGADALTQTGAQTAHAISQLLSNDNDGEGGAAIFDGLVGTPVNGTATVVGTDVVFTPNEDFAGNGSFQYRIRDSAGLTATATATVNVTTARDCGDGNIEAPEVCDDGGVANGDGCSSTCTVDNGFTCQNEPSTCFTTCGDTIIAGLEECDDGSPANLDNFDGCTTQCKLARACDLDEFSFGSGFSVDPATGHCYVGTNALDQPAAQAQCVASGGYLATIADLNENALAISTVSGFAWIGGFDPGGGFRWVTDEAFAFTNFHPGQPDGNGPCLLVLTGTTTWFDQPCNTVVPSICEFEPSSCGDSILQTTEGEECDDSNNTDGDGCDSLCQLEDGCGDGNLDPGEECDDDNINNNDACAANCTVTDGCGDGNLDAGEECDDDNVVTGDGCSATCKNEVQLVLYTFGAPNAAINTPTVTLPGLTGNGMNNSTGTATFVTVSTNPALSSNNWDVLPEQFFEFTLTPDPGRGISVTELAFLSLRSATGPTTWVADVIVNGATFQIGFGDHQTGFTLQTVPITGPAIGPHFTPVTIRIFGFGASSNAGTLRVDDVQLEGFLTP